MLARRHKTFDSSDLVSLRELRLDEHRLSSKQRSPSVIKLLKACTLDLEELAIVMKEYLMEEVDIEGILLKRW